MTAVEWYAEKQSELLMKLLKKELENESEYPDMARAIKAEALKMEKQQIEDAFQDGKWNGYESCKNLGDIEDPTDYYNKTFGGAGEPGR